MEYTNKLVIAEEVFADSGSFERALVKLVGRAEHYNITLIGLPALYEIDGVFHTLRLVEGTLENGVSHFNVEVV